MCSTMPVVAIVGWSRVGKTTFLEKLIPELKRRGYRIATIKHSNHPDIELDHPGTDSWRHAQAGSDISVFVTPRGVQIVEWREHSLQLEEILPWLHDVDLVLVEGYKSASVPKVEIVGAAQEKLISAPEQLLALITEHAREEPVPQFRPDDVASLADLLESRFFRGKCFA